MNEPNVVNREVILEQVADKGLFVICIRSVHLFTESFVSVFDIFNILPSFIWQPLLNLIFGRTTSIIQKTAENSWRG